MASAKSEQKLEVEVIGEWTEEHSRRFWAMAAIIAQRIVERELAKQREEARDPQQEDDE